MADINPSIFKAYDIRGVYPEEINGLAAYRIGRAYINYLRHNPVLEGPISVLVTADARVSSPELKAELIKGMCDEDPYITIIDAGLSTTPMHYFLINHLKADGGVMVTASHNPKEYNGFKLSRKGAVPIYGGGGMEEIKNTAIRGIFERPQSTGNVEVWAESVSEYIAFLLDSITSPIKPFKVVVDTGNGMAGLIMPDLLKELPIHAELLFVDIDMAFPNHEANPIKDDTLVDLKRRVVETGADFGVAFDGDADRIGFVTNKGERIPGDLVIAMLAQYYLDKEPGSVFTYDLRSSKVVPETIKALGGMPIETRVGHAFIKNIMREKHAVFGGEVSGHYYFRDFFYADSAMFAWLRMMEYISSRDKTLDELVQPLRKYASSGEIDLHVADRDQAVDKVAAHYTDALSVSYLDGLAVEYPDFWFLVRPSNTEPVLRLSMEAKNPAILEEKLHKLKSLLE